MTHYFCLRCLNPFWCQQSLNKHQEYCTEHEGVKTDLPKEGTMLKFENYHRSEKVPFVVYALNVLMRRYMNGRKRVIREKMLRKCW